MANLTIFSVIKFKTATHIHINQMSLNKGTIFSRSVKTNAVQQTMAHQLSIALTDHSCMCQIKKMGDNLRFH